MQPNAITLFAISLFLVFTCSCSKESLIPKVQTDKVEKVTYHSAVVIGKISEQGVLKVFSKGVVYSESPSPTLDNADVVISNHEDGQIIALLLLSPETTYFARTFATNDEGTGYGKEISFTTKEGGPAIGSKMGGGVVAYVYKPHEKGYVAGEFHGIIAAEQDTGKARFGCSGIQIITSKEIGAGITNMEVLTSSCNQDGTIGSLFLNFSLKGFSDWHIPSVDELEILYENKELIGGFKEEHYWSSSSSDLESGKPSRPYYNKLAHSRNFRNTYRSAPILRNNQANIRPVRYF